MFHKAWDWAALRAHRDPQQSVGYRLWQGGVERLRSLGQCDAHGQLLGYDIDRSAFDHLSQLFGEGSNDILYGEAGIDTLDGVAGDDLLISNGDGSIDIAVLSRTVWINLVGKQRGKLAL